MTLVLYRRRVFAAVKAEMRDFGARSIKPSDGQTVLYRVVMYV
jgi:hypothetical protein